MASPVADVYTAPAGAVLYAGRYPAGSVIAAGVAEALSVGDGAAGGLVPTAPQGLPAPLSVTSGVTGAAVPFTAGYAFRQNDVPAGQGVAITGATAQATVKNTWPDGSVKFAIIAGTVNATAGVPVAVTVAAGTASSGTALTTADLQAALTQPVTVDAGAFGSASWSGADWASPFEAWVAGHRMSSWVYRKPIGSDAHLVAWLEVRLYAGGAVEILPWVENGYLMVAGPTNKSATYTFTMGGTARFSAAIDIPHHCRTPLISGTATAHWLGADPGVTVLHETDYVQATGLVPAYMASVPSSTFTPSNPLPTSFTPMAANGWIAGNLGGTGYQPYIGMLPEWDAAYLVAPDTTTAKAVQFAAYGAGRYPTHYRDETDGHRPARLSQHPTLTIKEPEVDWETTPATSGTAPPSWSLTHQPSVGYLAYLITGRRYFLDELQFAASGNALMVSYSHRESGSGIFKSQRSGSVRLVAWCLRTLAQALSVSPDSDASLAADYTAILQNNIDWYYTRYQISTLGHNPFGFVENSEGPGAYGPSSAWWVATWMQDYFTAAFGYMDDLRLPISAPAQAKLSAFFAWTARSVIGRLGFTGADEYLYRDFAPYAIAASPSPTCDWDTGTGPWYSNWRDLYNATFSGSYSAQDGNPTPDAYASPGSFVEGPIRTPLNAENSAPTGALAAISYAVRRGVAGAEAAYQRLSSSAAVVTWQHALEAQPIWSIAPRPLPAWLHGARQWEWVEIPDTDMLGTPNVNTVRDTTGFAPGGGGNFGARLDAYCGVATDTRRSTLWTLAAGGHDDYYGNEVVRIDLRDAAPAWEIHHPGSNGDIVVSGGSSPPRYSDGLPASRHTYAQQVFIERHGRAVTLGGSYSVMGTVGQKTEAFDVDVAPGVNGWDAADTYPDSQSGLSALASATATKDPTTEIVYTFSATRLHQIAPAAVGPGGSYSFQSLSWNGAYNHEEGAAAVDFTRGKILWTHGYDLDANTQPYTWDIAGGALDARHTYTGAGAAGLAAVGASCGVVFEPQLDKYLLRGPASGAAVFSIDPVTFEVEAQPTVGGGSIPVQASTGAGGVNTGVYNKWTYLPALGGVAYLPGAGSNIWFLKTRGARSAITLPPGVSPRIACIGDSMLAPGSAGLGGPLPWVVAKLRGKLEFVANCGINGRTLDGLDSTIDNLYTDAQPGLAGLGTLGHVLIQIGTANARGADGTGGAALDDTFRAKYVSIITKALAYAQYVEIAALPPLGTGSNNKSAVFAQWNAYLASLPDLFGNGRVRFVDGTAGLADPDTGDIYPAMYQVDEGHLSYAGQYRIALSSLSTWEALIEGQGYTSPVVTDPADKYPATPQWNPNPTNLRTLANATFGAGWSGQAPDGWDIRGNGSGTGGTVALVTVPGEALWVEITPTSCAADSQIAITFPGSGRSITSGDPSVFDEVLEFELDGISNYGGINAWIQAGSPPMTTVNSLGWDSAAPFTESGVMRQKMARQNPAASGSATNYVYIGGQVTASGPMGSIRLRGPWNRG